MSLPLSLVCHLHLQTPCAHGVCTQGIRRQMAASSERNLYSHAATVLDLHFVPGRWENKPKNLTPGAQFTHALVETVRGQPMRPIEPYQIINYDITTEYIAAGSQSRRNSSHTDYVAISTTALDHGKRNVTSAYRAGEEMKCNGLAVQFMACISADGNLYPAVTIVKGWSLDAMPNDSFIPLEILGYAANAHLDIRLQELPGYVVLMRAGAKMEDFHVWFQNRIIRDTFQKVREKHGKTIHTAIPEDERARVWSDSDMTNIKVMTEMTRMEGSDAWFPLGLEFFCTFGEEDELHCYPLWTGSKRPREYRIL
jgi:hypothetical protein